MISGMVNLQKRGTDAWGSGAFGASRGGRRHSGIDYAAAAGQAIVAPASGTITKLGYCYADDLSYRYVQITDREGRDHRVFYVQPAFGLKVGQNVTHGSTIIGAAQDIASRYTDPARGPMTNHVHYEIKHNGAFIDPESVS